MQIFTNEFKNFLKRTLICSWRGHEKREWVEVYWAIGHSAGYRARFCDTCHKELETRKIRHYPMTDKMRKKSIKKQLILS